MAEVTVGQPVRVTIDGELADWYEAPDGKRHLVVQFQTDRRRLLEFPADTASVTVEARDG